MGTRADFYIGRGKTAKWPLIKWPLINGVYAPRARPRHLKFDSRIWIQEF